MPQWWFYECDEKENIFMFYDGHIVMTILALAIHFEYSIQRQKNEPFYFDGIYELLDENAL